MCTKIKVAKEEYVIYRLKDLFIEIYCLCKKSYKIKLNT